MSYNTILATAPLTTQNYHLKMIGTSIGNSLIWDNGTNVGIGNTNTSYTLDVSGTGRFTSTLLVSGALTGGGSITTSLSQATSTDLSVSNTSASNGAMAQISAINGGASQIDMVAFGSGSTGTLYGITKANLKVIRDNSLTAQSNGLAIGTDAAVPFYVFTNSVERMRITSAGNVLIGTTTETGTVNKLQVNGNIYISGGSKIQYSTTNSKSGDSICDIYNTSSTGYGAYIQAGVNTTTYYALTVNNYAGTGLFNIAGNGDVQFGTGTGNLIYNPSATAPALQLSGSTSSNTIGSSAYITLKDATNSRFWAIQANASQDLSLWHKNASWVNVGNFNNSTGIYTPTSNINKKKDFEASTIGLNEVLQLKPTLYRMKADDESEPKQLGFLAQEVEPFIPQAYVESKGEGEDKFIGLNYNAIVAALVKAVQEQNQTIQSLQEQINILAK